MPTLEEMNKGWKPKQAKCVVEKPKKKKKEPIDKIIDRNIEFSNLPSFLNMLNVKENGHHVLIRKNM